MIKSLILEEKRKFILNRGLSSIQNGSSRTRKARKDIRPPNYGLRNDMEFSELYTPLVPPLLKWRPFWILELKHPDNGQPNFFSMWDNYKILFFYHGVFISWLLNKLIFMILRGPEGLLAYFKAKRLFWAIFQKSPYFLAF